jgi:hypothetical protein
MNLMRSILLFVWVLGCFSGRLRDPVRNMCLQVDSDFSYRLKKCDGLPAQQFHLEGQLLKHRESGSCIPSVHSGATFTKMWSCSMRGKDIKMNGTTVKEANDENVCLISVGGHLGFFDCVKYNKPNRSAIMMFE